MIDSMTCDSVFALEVRQDDDVVDKLRALVRP